MDQEQFQVELGNLLNQQWGNLLGQRLIEIEQLKFQNSQQVIQIQEMIKTVDDLRKELHQAQCDMLAAQGKAIIDSGSIDEE